MIKESKRNHIYRQALQEARNEMAELAQEQSVVEVELQRVKARLTEVRAQAIAELEGLS